MLEKLFGWGKKKEGPEAEPVSIRFGRYSDNNKTAAKIQRWNEADNLFKEKRYTDCIVSFFDYLRDEEADNVHSAREGDHIRFTIYQGSKMVRGSYNQEQLTAEVTLARMANPSVPVMRRLLEQNFNLYYTRYALEGDRLCMRFDTPAESANPNKLYYALKELATHADKQDDLLVNDFAALERADTEHLEPVPGEEKEVKYRFFRQWIEETLQLVSTLDAEKQMGGVSYLLLNLAFRIDYLLVPEGKLLLELEELVNIYFSKDEKPVTEKNKQMISSFRKLLTKSREDFNACLFRSRHTFAITVPQPSKAISDTIYNANQNMLWFRDNNHPEVAQQISEYGLAYCQYHFSLPRPLTELYHQLMMVRYADFFTALGVSEPLYNAEAQSFNREQIEQNIHVIIQHWREKYPQMQFRTESLHFDNLLNFTHSFTAETEFVNTETK